MAEEVTTKKGSYACTVKNPIVRKYVKVLKKHRSLMLTSSERQLELYDLFIRWIEIASDTITMKSVRSRQNAIEEDMECSCHDEVESKGYRIVFNSLNPILQGLIYEEIELGISMNKHCAIFQRAIDLGLMDDSERWIQGRSTWAMRALWVEIYCEKHDIKNKWKWAKDKWGDEYKDLGKYRDQSINQTGKVENEDVINRCFVDDDGEDLL